MSIAQQFAGLRMDQLIGGPLSAAADASTQLANSTASFINKVGFDSNGKARTVAFGYQKRSMNDDGTSNLDEMKVEVPMLAIVPIPNLQIDEVNILFDMEVKQSEQSESSTDMSASMSGSGKFLFVKVNVSGSVSSHSSNTRSSDNSAKYHVDVRATNHGTPEGLARVLDMMAANVAPELVGSTIKDGNGQTLPEKARIKAEKLKELRQEISNIENRLTAANESLGTSITQLRKLGTSQHNVYQGIFTKLINSVDTTEVDKKIKEAGDDEAARQAAETEKAGLEKQQADYSAKMDEVNQSWNNFMNEAGDIIKLIADNGGDNTNDGLSDMFSLKAVTPEGADAEYDSNQTYYKSLVGAQKSAVKSQINVNQIEAELMDKRSEYNNLASGTTN